LTIEPTLNYSLVSDICLIQDTMRDLGRDALDEIINSSGKEAPKIEK
jgi:hypothetical protein